MEKVLSSNGVNLCKVEIIELCADVRDGTTYTMIPLYIFSVVCCCMLHTQAMTVSQCGKYLVAGGFDCKVRVFLAHSLERNYVYEAFTSSIRSLHFSHDQRWVRKSLGRL